MVTNSLTADMLPSEPEDMQLWQVIIQQKQFLKQVMAVGSCTVVSAKLEESFDIVGRIFLVLTFITADKVQHVTSTLIVF